MMKRIIGRHRFGLIAFIIILTISISMIVCYANIEEIEMEWSETFGGSNWDEAHSVQQTSDGGYIVAGGTGSYGDVFRDFWLIKTDSEGNEEWNKTFGGSDGDNADSVQQTSDGGYIVAGETRSYGAGKSDFWLIKTDSEGNEEWNKTFGGSDWENADSVKQTSDSGYIIAGWTNSYGFSIENCWLVKTDSEGNREWSNVLENFSWTQAHSVQQTSDGGYIVAGWIYGTVSRDFWLIKTDSEGNKEWSKTFGGSNWDIADSIQQTQDGGYIIAGETGSYGAGKGDFWLIKTDSEGNEEWNKTFGGSERDNADSVQQTSDGGYIVAGWTYSYGAGGGDFWLIKTDSEGNEEWNKTFGGSNTDWAHSVQQTLDGGYIMAGYTKSFGAGGSDVYLIKVRPIMEKIFDTGQPENPYPSIMGTHNGTLTPSHNINVSKMYTYACVGTGGHTESIKLYEIGELIASGSWDGYQGDYHNITIHNLTGGTQYVTLLENHEYNYTIITGSYPQIHHNTSLLTPNGWINCTSFVDANGKKYDNWIPAIRLE
jgi:hypothetical protein